MAAYDHALFYNSNNGDRVYDADSFEYLLKKFFTTGVFAGDCAVSPVSGMKIKMGAGYCNIGGKVRFFAEDTEFTLTTAHATYNRIDTVVIERNDSDREITAKVVTGTPGTNPSATAPIRSGAIYQIVVAEIAVAAGAVGVTAIDITDKRIDSSVCGLVASTVGQPDFEDLYTQFTAAFDEWFDEMKDQLSEDAAGNLQNEIDDLDDEVVKHTAQTLTDAQKTQARSNLGLELEDVKSEYSITPSSQTSSVVKNVAISSAYKSGCIVQLEVYFQIAATIEENYTLVFNLTTPYSGLTNCHMYSDRFDNVKTAYLALPERVINLKTSKQLVNNDSVSVCFTYISTYDDE